MATTKYSVSVADTSFGGYRLIHIEDFDNYADAEERHNSICFEVFEDCRFGDPSSMDVITSSSPSGALGHHEVILDTDMADFRFFTDEA